MKKSLICSGQFFMAVLFLAVLFYPGPLNALRKFALKAEVISLPSFRGDISAKGFHSIAIDGKNGNIALASDQGWCEIPYKNGVFDLKRAFIAPTKGFRLKAAAAAPGNLYVFDMLSGMIMGSNKKYALPVKIIRPTAMTYHGHRIYLADMGKKIIYELEFDGTKMKVRNRFSAHKGLCGLASDGSTLYSCSSSRIVAFDKKMKATAVYTINVNISGITCTRKGEIIASARDKAEIYRFRIP